MIDPEEHTADEASKEAPKDPQGDSKKDSETSSKAAPVVKKKTAKKKVAKKKTVKKKTAKKKTKASKASKPKDAGDAEDAEADESETEAAPKSKKKGKSLVIVESPAKARTINKYLGKDFVVRASMGHIRDLPKGKFGIDLENNFTPEYTTIRGKGKVIAELKRLAKNAPAIYLAPDLDREGEAIAWHLSEALEIGEIPTFRVVFNEITKRAILAAFDHPGEVDMNKVDAQQARRVLDRIMGYKLSPLLWKKIAKGLSAGRVQSVAVRLLVEREKEIRAFVQEEFWRVTAHMEVDGQAFDADLRRLDGKRIDKNLDAEAAKAVVEGIGSDPLVLTEIEDKPKTRRPTPPFTTSQLQQKASTMLRFSARKTMMIAQQLYEGVEVSGEGSVGLITYMRTDSVRVSKDSQDQARSLIESMYGADYVPAKPNAYSSKSKGAQEAHEAVRPTDATRTPEKLASALTTDQLKLYRLIWNKFMGSQMTPARFTITTAMFDHGPARFVAQGDVMRFDGHLRVFNTVSVQKAAQKDTKEAKEGEPEAKKKEQALPKSLEQGKPYLPKEVEPSQHFTQPPPRFSEATLVKELEKRGIGRPSTYATIISTIQDRGYVNLETRRFFATELGEIVTDQLVAHFGDVINTDFTSQMEADLDLVEAGDMEWKSVIAKFHKIFARDLEKADGDMKNLKLNPELSDRKCDKCDSPMAILYNKRGKFLGCSKYPDCKNTMSVDGPREKAEVIETDHKCPKCESAMVVRTGSRGRFLACTAFPKCKSTMSVDDDNNPVKPKETGIKCDKCEKPMVIKGSRRGPFLACSGFPKCRNAKPLPDELREPPKETGEKCDKCGEPMVMKTSRWGKEFLACSAYPECKNTRNPDQVPGQEAEAETEGAQ